MHKVEQIHKTQIFPRGNHKGENPVNFLIIVSSLRKYHKMKKPKYKKYFASLFLSLSFLHVLLSLLTQT